eukprot:scaffold4501_cov320-Pinguiococcus_pyrenoidosus.AAC.12
MKILILGLLAAALKADDSVSRHVTGLIECPGGTVSVRAGRASHGSGEKSREKVYLFEVPTPQTVEFSSRDLGLTLYEVVASDRHDGSSSHVILGSILQVGSTSLSKPFDA